MTFQSLSQFYNSDLWTSFRASLIAERINPDDGILYSEYSGKPIVKAYDIIAHHRTPLTMQNVNDFSVSLNPSNIQLVSFAEHNEIHGRFGFCAQRKVYVVYGAPCSGKTSWVQQNKGNSDFVLDMDNIWQCITAGSRYDKPNALKQNAFTIRDCMMDMVKTRAGKWERAFVIIGGAVKSDRQRVIERLSAEGVFIQETQETCLNRLLRDDTRTKQQKDEWRKFILKWFEDYKE